MAVKKAKKVVKKAKKVTKFDRHSHITCDHKLKFCKHCDTAYCSKCNAEWKKSSWTYSIAGSNQYLCGGGTQGTGGSTFATGTGDTTLVSTANSTEQITNHKEHNKK